MKRTKDYIKVNGKRYELISTKYDPLYGCYFYYVKDQDEPFCDLNDEVETIGRNWRNKH